MKLYRAIVIELMIIDVYPLCALGFSYQSWSLATLNQTLSQQALCED